MAEEQDVIELGTGDFQPLCYRLSAGKHAFLN